MDVWSRTVFVKAKVVLCRFSLNGNDSVPEELDNAKIEARSVEIRLVGKVPCMDSVVVELEEFTDVIGRNFRQPEQGLGFDNSPVAHMWRAMIRPAKYL